MKVDAVQGYNRSPGPEADWPGINRRREESATQTQPSSFPPLARKRRSYAPAEVHRADSAVRRSQGRSPYERNILSGQGASCSCDLTVPPALLAQADEVIE